MSSIGAENLIGCWEITKAYSSQFDKSDEFQNNFLFKIRKLELRAERGVGEDEALVEGMLNDYVKSNRINGEWSCFKTEHLTARLPGYDMHLRDEIIKAWEQQRQ